MRVVYADVVFALNFSVDFIVLYAVSKLLCRKVKYLRLCLGAGFGAVAALAVTVANTNRLLNLALSPVVCSAVCIISFGKSSIKLVVKQTALFYGVSMLLCGFLTLLSENIIKGSLLPWLLVVMSGVFGVLFSCMTAFFHRNIHSTTEKILVEVCGKEYSYTVICDSGNFLCDTYSQLPVILLGARAKDELVGDCLHTAEYLKLRYIPVNTVISEGVIPVVKPEKIWVIRNRKRILVQCVVGFVENQTEFEKETDGIMPVCLVENIQNI